jgi:hypothetical protein
MRKRNAYWQRTGWRGGKSSAPMTGGRGRYLEQVPDVIYCDGSIVNGICIPDRNQAGDILPTFVTPDDARRYIDEVDAGYRRLDTAIQGSNAVDTTWKTSWGIQLGTWTAFALPAKTSVGWLNTTAVMDQTDRFNDQLKNWYANFQTMGGTPPGPPPTGPGQGVPGTTNTTADLTKLVTAVGITAAVILVAPKLLAMFK